MIVTVYHRGHAAGASLEREDAGWREEAALDLLSPEVLALLDHLAEEIAAEYLRLLAPEPGTPIGPDQRCVVGDER